MLTTLAPVRANGPAGDIDLYDTGVYVTGSPHTAWRRLRDEVPVCRLAAPDGTPFWSVVCHQDVTQVLRDSATFTSEHSTMLSELAGDVAKGRAINLLDGPRHTELKAPAMRGMSAAVLRGREPVLRQRLRQFVATCLDEREVNLAAAMAVVPMLLSGDILGIPAEHWRHAARWTMASVAPGDPAFATGGVSRTLAQAHVELLTLFTELLAARRDRPEGDLISLLAQVEPGGRRLDDPDVIVNAYAFVMGASITTPQVIAHLVLVTGGRPDLWRAIRADGSLLESAVEEALRWSSPINHLLRLATAPAQLGGQRIHPGDLVCAWTASANRDEKVFHHPFTFDPARSPNPHLAFGLGTHRCAGVHIARTGLRILLDELAAQVDRIELTGSPRHLASNFVNGITSLPVRLYPV